MKTKIQKFLVSVALTLVAGSAIAVPVRLDITFDNFPNETAFGIWDAGVAPSGADYFNNPGLAFDGIAYDVAASSDIGFGDGFVLPGDFGGGEAGGSFHFIWDLGVGMYRFIIMDDFGDGICCDFGAGSYALSVDGAQVGGGGVFMEFEVTDFDVNDVPEPGILSLLALGLIGFGITRRRKIAA